MKTTKKVLSVVFALMFVFSAFSITSFAADTKTQTLIDTAKNGKQVAVTFTAGDTILGSATDKIYIKGDNAAYDYTNGFFTVRVVIRDNTAYAYFPSLPFFYVKVDSLGLGTMDVWSLIEKISGVTFTVLSYQKSYEGEVNGKTYYIEEYNDRAMVTSKFCYEGDELKLLNVYDAKTFSTQNTYFESISFTVDDSVVAKPTGIDVTPLLKGLFVMMLSSAAV